MSPASCAWLRRARERAVVEPLRPRAALDLEAGGTRHRIGSIEPEIATRIAAAGLPVQRIDEGFFIAAPAEAALRAIARWLHDERIATHWRDELLAVTAADGRVLGVVERDVVRVLGLSTNAVHLIGRDAAGRTWVQLRAATKSTDPGRWDTLMGGQVAAKESIAETLARETMEEAGLGVADLRELERGDPVVLRRPVRDGYMVERIEVFRALVPNGVSPVNRDGEVERFEALADSELVDRLAADAFTLEATLILGAELERRGVVAAGTRR